MKLATTPKGKLRKFFSPEQVATALGYSRKTILRMIDRKELTAVAGVANRLRIPEDDLERLLQQRLMGRPFRPNTDPRQKGGTEE